MTVIEAMAAARPVVATKVGDLPRVVVDGETGFLVDRRDQTGFTRALLSLVQSPALAVSMGLRGRDRAQLFSAERMAERYLELYTVLRAQSERRLAARPQLVNRIG